MGCGEIQSQSLLHLNCSSHPKIARAQVWPDCDGPKFLILIPRGNQISPLHFCSVPSIKFQLLLASTGSGSSLNFSLEPEHVECDINSQRNTH